MKRIIHVIKPAIVTALFFVAVNASAVPVLTYDGLDDELVLLALTDTQVTDGIIYGADLNDDGAVNFSDLFLFKTIFGSAVPVFSVSDADLNDDGIVNVIDLGLLKAAFNSTSGVYPRGTALISATGPKADAIGNNVSLSEPSTLGMFALGFAFAIGFRRWPKAA